MKLKIFGCNDSRHVRVLWTAEEMNLDYQLEMMPFPPRFLQKEYLDTNILGTVPYLIDGDIEMTESVAICQYLAEKYGPTDLKVSPDEDDFPAYLNWMAHSDATLTFPQTVYLRYAFQEIGVADNAAEGYKRWFVARLKLLEKTLEEKEYLCGNRLTLADICVGYAIYLAKCLNIEKAFKPNIVRWTNMLFEREAFKKAISLRHED
jgi:glutathione S-transferase